MNTHNNNSIKQSNADSSEHITPVMLVVRHAGHEREPSEQHQYKLDPVLDQLGTAPGEALLEVHLLEQEYLVTCRAC